MKDKIHPAYDFVMFRCPATGTEILTRSTKLNGTKMQVKGREMPSVAIEICSDNHPFYSGQKSLVDTAGRVDAFNKRYAKKAAAEPEKK